MVSPLKFQGLRSERTDKGRVSPLGLLDSPLRAIINFNSGHSRLVEPTAGGY